MRSSVTCLTVAVLGLMLSGCGGKASDSGDTAGSGGGETVTADADLDPCSLLTPAEMTAITSDAVSGTSREGTDCIYRSNPNETLTVTVKPTGGVKEMETVRRAADLLGGIGAGVAGQGGAAADAAQMLKKDGSATPSIGDEAHWGVANILSVRKGDAFVMIIPPMVHDPANHKGYPLIPDAERRTIAETIASKVLAKIS